MVSQSEERKEISFYKMEFQGWINSIHSLAKVYIFFKFYFIFFKFYFYVLFDINLNSNLILKLFKNID